MGKLHHAPISIDPLLYGYTSKVAPSQQKRRVLYFFQLTAFLYLMETSKSVD